MQRSRNPHNIARTPGGSSGGEGALVASRSVPLAIGTDIGGSIRIPAAFCGVAGFKPTPERVTKHGISAPRPNNEVGQNAVRGVVGPLARSVADLCEVMACWWGRDNLAMRAADPFCPKSGYSNEAYDLASIRVGVFVDDGWFEPAPSCVRAVEEASRALERAGCNVVPFTFFDDERGDRPFNAEYVKAYYGLLSADGNLKSFLSGLDGEELIKEYSELKIFANIPNFIRGPLASILRALGQERPATLLTIGKGKSAYEQTHITTHTHTHYTYTYTYQ